MALQAVVPGRIWVAPFPIRYAGTRFLTRMTVVRLQDGRLWLHSPIPLDEPLEAEIRSLGKVAFIIAPSTFHHLYVSKAMRLWPQARTFACPGLLSKRPDLEFDAVLADHAEPEWDGEFDQVRSRGNNIIREVVFFHRDTRTLIVVDLLENFHDDTPGTNLALRLGFRLFGLWGRPVPAPEFLMFTWDKRSSEQAISRMLQWDFQRVIMAHGEWIEGPDVKDLVREAWKPLTRQWNRQ